MRKLHPFFYIKNRSTSLFLRLLSGFLCITLLLSTLTLYSFTVSKQNVRKEIVKYNTLMLHNTMESYEKHFDMIKRQMLLYFISEKVQKFHSNPKYIDFPGIQQDINSWVSNNQLFINNIVLYSKRNEMILEKGTSTKVDTMFQVFYENDAYLPDFWRGQFNQVYNIRIFPSAIFHNQMYRDQTGDEELIPVIIKTAGNSDFMMIVFLDASKMYEAFHRTINEDFMIHNGQGLALFRSKGQDPPIDLEELGKHSTTEYQREAAYYFQSTGAESGFTYVQRVPIERIASQTRLNITLIIAIAISIAASIVISWLFAAGINNPLQKVIATIRGENDGSVFRSSIREFNIIRHQLQDKNKMHKQLSFLHQLRAIQGQDAAPIAFVNKPFMVVLFHAMIRGEGEKEQSSFQTWLSYMNVYMENRLSKAFPGSLTFQVEHNQILSLVFSDRREELASQLARMEALFEQDRAFGTITMGVSSVHRHSEEIAVAYREVQILIQERRMIDTTQIIMERREQADLIAFASDQWKEFQVNLREGNELQLTKLVERTFIRWLGKEPTAATMVEFGGSLVGKIKSEASPLDISLGRLQSIFQHAESQLQACITMKELEQLLLNWVTQAAEAFREKKQLRDPITSFVVDYVTDHLEEEIYLDLLAERLNLSGSYLSYYFKEKTGMNIVDFINEKRIMQATTLLADNKLKIHDVAAAVGYRNITSFNRMFKKYVGLTPSEFRKKPEFDS
ncbi:hypothetical protein GCM10008018_08260 [Paenibacillus marchantiophytorum]|uniref:HTH araC/xylS-type domain-containing protein n=1 Tax=Paenibacillus marchantiophytorum TaxID=1619310 RepID=A0ABQ2BRT6_9BACL|nr:AraC family transcriptional regulator [Paenibacillus marchantiophytorum]GGI44671.1 hypothetical protein GCM10008018_08260 [Paenibacillus marchantiophytorum]